MRSPRRSPGRVRLPPPRRPRRSAAMCGGAGPGYCLRGGALPPACPISGIQESDRYLPSKRPSLRRASHAPMPPYQGRFKRIGADELAGECRRRTAGPSSKLAGRHAIFEHPPISAASADLAQRGSHPTRSPRASRARTSRGLTASLRDGGQCYRSPASPRHQRPVQDRCPSPVALNGALRHAPQRCNLGKGETAEEFEIDELR